MAIVRESQPGTVFDISSDGTAAVVKAPRSEFRLPAEDPLEFPSVATFPTEASFELSQPLVRELVRRTVFSTDNESSRYALGGVLLELSTQSSPASVIAVGTDGRRLAKMEGPATAKDGSPADAQPIVPARAMQLMERCLSDASMPVQIAFNEGAPLYIELPTTVELVVASTEPGLQGDRSSAGTKPATLETGAEIQVPLFINTGDKLKVDSRDGNYLGRVNT
jgi:DNA polymerase III sliding clamp (beta) subunit (PCNA family)